MATLINGDGNQAIYAQQDADWFASIIGGQTFITAVGNKFDYELLDANTIGVKDGVIITKEGRRIQLDANVIDSFDIPTGSQGATNYYIIGYHLVTGDLSEQTAETFVQLMDNATDTIPEGSFRDGDDDVYISLYRVQQNDLTIGTITLLLPRLSGSLQSQINELNNDLTWEHTSTAILPTVTNPSGTYNINTEGYKAICVRGAFANGGVGHNIISLDELKSMPSQTYQSNVFGTFGSQGTYGGVIGFILTQTSIKIDGKWIGSDVSSHNLTVYGLK